jgi:putative two-component system response regulator
MTRASILVVDNMVLHRTLMQETLEAEGHAVIAVESAEAALGVLATTRPDLLLVDAVMPGMDGFELCRHLKQREATRLLPLVLVTELRAAEDRIRGIEAGADDFLSKPVQLPELLARVRSLLLRKRYTDQLEQDHAAAVLYSLARSVEAKDPALEGHCERLAHIAVAMGRALGLGAESLEALRRGALLHDIGKVGIPDAILMKPGPLNADEWKVMRQHPVIGERICLPLRSMGPVLPIIRHHHERWDGSGYPDGLTREAIPLPARILQVADVFDALTMVRPYQQALSAAEASALLRAQAANGLHEPRLVELFQRLWESGALRNGASRADGAGRLAEAQAVVDAESDVASRLP